MTPSYDTFGVLKQIIQKKIFSNSIYMVYEGWDLSHNLIYINLTEKKEKKL